MHIHNFLISTYAYELPNSYHSISILIKKICQINRPIYYLFRHFCSYSKLCHAGSLIINTCYNAFYTIIGNLVIVYNIYGHHCICIFVLFFLRFSCAIYLLSNINLSFGSMDKALS